MSLRVLTAADVERAIAGLSEGELLFHTGKLFYGLSHSRGNDNSQCPPRSSMESNEYTMLTMPGYVPEVGMSVKLVGVPRRSATPLAASRTSSGLPATTIVLDERTGTARAVINARQLTALRTAAGSLLATKLVIKNEKPKSLILFGAGLQIQYHARLLLNTFSSIENCYIVNRSINPRSTELHRQLVEWYPGKRVELLAFSNGENEERDENEKRETIAKCTLEADILCFATSATTPLIPSSSNSNSWVKSGAHIILVGSYTPLMHEVPTSIIKRTSKVIVDSREHAMREAGELIDAQLDAQTDLIELGELLTEDGQSPQHNAVREAQKGDITCFKSVGLAVQVTWSFTSFP